MAAIGAAIELADVDRPPADTEEELAAYVSEYLAHFGAETREAEVIISGSTVPLIDVGPGESWTSRADGVGNVMVRLS